MISLILFIIILFLLIKLSVRNKKFDKFFNNKSIDKNELISFRHEFGETIFELQQQMESLKKEIDDLKQRK